MKSTFINGDYKMTYIDSTHNQIYLSEYFEADGTLVEKKTYTYNHYGDLTQQIIKADSITIWDYKYTYVNGVKTMESFYENNVLKSTSELINRIDNYEFTYKNSSQTTTTNYNLDNLQITTTIFDKNNLLKEKRLTSFYKNGLLKSETRTNHENEVTFNRNVQYKIKDNGTLIESTDIINGHSRTVEIIELIE